ncbi:Pre-rRNA-processing protein TSR2-domain-containing protein [Phellopilus nigrolimitatus]|nr:Pre-rRNA-processing protein TSR2-domain-containing protein [Phellopilus nigrolimitatus]
MASSSSAALASAPEPSLVLFARGVIARLSVWPALRLAVEQSWGGPESAQKRTWMASVIVDAFDPSESTETPDIDYIEDTLLQIMADEFDAVLEDGSAEAVAKDIVKLWTDVRDAKGKETVESWENQARKIKGKKVASQEVVDENAEFDEESGSDDDWEDEEKETDVDEAPQLLDSLEQKRREGPTVDDDGFTIVKGKGESHK